MGKIQDTKQYIVPGALISASYVSDLYDLLTGNIPEDIVVTGSITVQTGSFVGNLIGTSSWAESSSYSISSSYSVSSSFASASGTSSYAVKALGANNFTVGGNLQVNGTATFNKLVYQTASSVTITGSNNFGDDITDLHSFTGSLSISGSILNPLYLDLSGLPIDDPHNAGQVWRSGNFLMISLG